MGPVLDAHGANDPFDGGIGQRANKAAVHAPNLNIFNIMTPLRVRLWKVKMLFQRQRPRGMLAHCAFNDYELADFDDAHYHD